MRTTMLLSSLTLVGLPAAGLAQVLLHETFDAAGDGPGGLAGWAFEVASGEPVAERIAAEEGEGGFARITRESTGQCDLRPAGGGIRVVPDRGCLLTARIRATNVEAESHGVELQWFGDAGYLGRSAVAAVVADRWVTAAVGPVLPPANATQVFVLLRCYAPGRFDFDDIRLEQVGPWPESLTVNPGFESDADGDDAPDEWSASPQGASWDATDAATGARCGRLERAGADAPPAWWRQDGIAIEAGARYELSAATRCDGFGRDLRLTVQWRHGDDVLTEESYEDQTFNAWQRKSLIATAPPTADRASVIVELMSEGALWTDDVALSYVGMLAEATLDILRPNPRGLVRVGVDDAVVAIRVRANAAIEGTTCSVVSQVDIARPLTTFEAPGEAEVQLDTSGLALGQYAVAATVNDADGLVLAEDRCFIDVLPADAPGVFFREDHIAEVHGRPWFPIGVTSISPAAGEAQRLADAGFNLLVPGGLTGLSKEEAQAALDRAQELGLHVMEWNNGWVYPAGTPDEARESAIAQMADTIAGHPAFLGLMCDEAIWNGIPLADVMHSYHTFRRTLPTLLYWQNQAPRNSIEDLARYCRAADVSGMDIYPVEGSGHSDLPNKTLSVVGDEVQKNRQTVEDAKPIWAILQGFGWGAWEADPAAHRRAPDWHETRFMAYDSIVNGAVGIVYWGASYEDRESEIWQHLRRIAGELRDLTPVLVSPDRVDVTVESPSDSFLVIGRRVEGRLWVIVVNESPDPAEAVITLPDGVGTLAAYGDGGDLEVANGRLTDALEGYGVRVLHEPL